MKWIINYEVTIAFLEGLKKATNIIYVFLVIYVFLLEEAMYSYRSLCIHTVVYVFLDAATLTEVFPCFFLSCKANARV